MNIRKYIDRKVIVDGHEYTIDEYAFDDEGTKFIAKGGKIFLLDDIEELLPVIDPPAAAATAAAASSPLQQVPRSGGAGGAGSNSALGFRLGETVRMVDGSTRKIESNLGNGTFMSNDKSYTYRDIERRVPAAAAAAAASAPSYEPRSAHPGYTVQLTDGTIHEIDRGDETGTFLSQKNGRIFTDSEILRIVSRGGRRSKKSHAKKSRSKKSKKSRTSKKNRSA